MYTQLQQTIRNSLWNFMGSIMDASCNEDVKKENVTALISEEMCKFCRIEDENKESKIDMKTARPILEAAIWILSARKLELQNLSVTSKSIDYTIKELDSIIKSLEMYVKRI